MNGTQTDLPLPDLADPQPIHAGWTWRRIILLILLAFIIHMALLFSLGAKKNPVPRPVGAVPHLQLALASDELVALENPALFALPNPKDFASVIWSQMPAIQSPSFKWSEAPRWLPLSAESLGSTFTGFIHTNVFAMSPLNFKPAPQFPPVPVLIPDSPGTSTLEISPSLAARHLVFQPDVPVLSGNDVVASSRVRVVVDNFGDVISSIALPAGNNLESTAGPGSADTNAVALARSLRFHPGPGLTFGDVIFYWHTIPLVSTNTP